MNDKRLVKQLTGYWQLLRKNEKLPIWEHFNQAAIGDIMEKCCVWNLEHNYEKINSKIYTYTYQYIGRKAQKAFGKDITGEVFSSKFKHFPAARITLRLDECVTEKLPIYDEGQFINENNKLIKFRSCLLPFGNKTGKVSNILLGLSWIEL